MLALTHTFILPGKGVYFATNSFYSNRYAHPDSNGLKRIFLCRVAVGEYHKGRDGQIAPDERNNKKHILYDSTTDSMDDAERDMFVTYHDAQACKYIAVCSYLVALLTISLHTDPLQTPITYSSIFSSPPAQAEYTTTYTQNRLFPIRSTFFDSWSSSPCAFVFLLLLSDLSASYVTVCFHSATYIPFTAVALLVTCYVTIRFHSIPAEE